MRRMITGKDAEIFKNIAADGTKTVVSGDLDVGGNITKNGQPIGGGSKEKVIFTVSTASDSNTGTTILTSDSAANAKLEKVKVGDVISIIRKEGGSAIKEVVTLTCVKNEMPFSGMGLHFICKGSGYCDNSGVNNICSGYIDIASSGQDGPILYLSNTASASTQYYSNIAVGDKVEIYF